MNTSLTRAAARRFAAAALLIILAAVATGCARTAAATAGKADEQPIALTHLVGVGECGPKPERTLSFPSEQLYGHIDGGAELFLEFGFKLLTVQTFRSPRGLQVDLETYHMESPTAAYAIYLAKCGREQPRPDVPGRNTANAYQITMLLDSDFVQANNFTGDPAGLEFAVSLLRCQMAGRLVVGAPVLPELLPPDGLLPGSEALVRGQFSLQPIVTLGEGDVLQLGGKTWGAVGSYERPQGEPEIRVYVRYPDAAAARGVLESVLANLDPYLTVTERGADGFEYTDWRGWPGRVSVDGQLLIVHVPAEPATAPAPAD